MRAPALGPEQARQEALTIASVRAELGVGVDDPDDLDAPTTTSAAKVEASA
jgi:hypothetical protein